MSGLIGATALALLLILPAVVSVPGFYAALRRRIPRESKLEIWPVMARLGVRAEDAPGAETKMARAVRRCVMCRSISQCQAWLAAGRSDGLDEFCPNASLFDWLQKR